MAAVRVRGFIPNDPHAVELAGKSLQDKNSTVRAAAAATALGLMHASAADTGLKQALKDKNLAVVMAAAHALSLLVAAYLREFKGSPSVSDSTTQRNSTSASIVSLGCSSMSQCPVPFNSMTLTSVATRFICGLRIAALPFSPAIDKTGMVN